MDACNLVNMHCWDIAQQLIVILAQVDTNGTAPPMDAPSSPQPWWKQLDMYLLLSTYGLIALMYTLTDEVSIQCHNSQPALSLPGNWWLQQEPLTRKEDLARPFTQMIPSGLQHHWLCLTAQEQKYCLLEAVVCKPGSWDECMFGILGRARSASHLMPNTQVCSLSRKGHYMSGRPFQAAVCRNAAIQQCHWCMQVSSASLVRLPGRSRPSCWVGQSANA